MGLEGASTLTLEEIGLAVVRIETKLDALAAAGTDHENRIRSLELQQARNVTTKMFWSALVGITGFVGAVAEVLYVVKK